MSNLWVEYDCFLGLYTQSDWLVLQGTFNYLKFSRALKSLKNKHLLKNLNLNQIAQKLAYVIKMYS